MFKRCSLQSLLCHELRIHIRRRPFCRLFVEPSFTSLSSYEPIGPADPDGQPHPSEEGLPLLDNQKLDSLVDIFDSNKIPSANQVRSHRNQPHPNSGPTNAQIFYFVATTPARWSMIGPWLVD
jgi:hypothetical protein